MLLYCKKLQRSVPARAPDAPSEPRRKTPSAFARADPPSLRSNSRATTSNGPEAGRSSFCVDVHASRERRSMMGDVHGGGSTYFRTTRPSAARMTSCASRSLISGLSVPTKKIRTKSPPQLRDGRTLACPAQRTPFRTQGSWNRAGTPRVDPLRSARRGGPSAGRSNLQTSASSSSVGSVSGAIKSRGFIIWSGTRCSGGSPPVIRAVLKRPDRSLRSPPATSMTGHAGATTR